MLTIHELSLPGDDGEEVRKTVYAALLANECQFSVGTVLAAFAKGTWALFECLTEEYVEFSDTGDVPVCTNIWLKTWLQEDPLDDARHDPASRLAEVISRWAPGARELTVLQHHRNGTIDRENKLIVLSN